jgi:hypothetical protein
MQRLAGPHNPWVRLGIVATLAAVVVVILDLLLVRWMDAARHTPDDTVAATDRMPEDLGSNSALPPPVPNPSDSVGLRANPDRSPHEKPRGEPPATKALGPGAPPTVVIKRLEPAEPEVGKSLEILLEASGPNQGKLTYQFRVQPETKWQTAEGGLLTLSRLRAGPLVLEVRVVDEHGTTSPVVTRRLVVKSIPEPAKATARFKVGNKFFQEVVITRRSAYRILGVDIGQNVQYGFVSSFTTDKVERDGSCVFTQKVETARFGEGDRDLQALLADSLRKTEGAKFELAVGSSGEILRFKGAQDPVKVFADRNPLGGQTFLLWSFLDDDAWKELAQITFLQPDKPLRKGATWTRPLSHAWGPLGGWTGKTAYAAAGKQAGLERINYAHQMTYAPPRGGGRDLPFQVQKAEFKPQTAGGAILFDAGRSRVAAAEETFHVRGVVVLAVAGTEATVEMDEAQLFRLRMVDQEPAK